jgi:hypothetical protein
MRRIEAGRMQLDDNSVPNDGIILAALAGNTRADCRGGLLPDPDMDQPPELDNAEQNRQQHECDNQHRLERFLSALPPASAGSCHDACVSRCTIWPILATKPLFQAMMPTTSVPRMMAAPITHSSVDCPRFKVFTCSLQWPLIADNRLLRLIQTPAA